MKKAKKQRNVWVKEIHGRWQPVDAGGWIISGKVYNADGRGYATKEAAGEAAAMLRVIPVELAPCDECGRPTPKNYRGDTQTCSHCILRLANLR